MAKTKVELIIGAYEVLRISGLTMSATPDEISLGLDELEGMMNEFEARNICSSYVFENEPQLNTNANVQLAYQKAIEYNLALRLAPYFGKELTAGLMRIAIASLSTWSSASSITRQIRNPNRMPRGSGAGRTNRMYSRFYRQEAAAPNDCATLFLKVYEINNFDHNFEQYLYPDETIASYEIKADDGLELISSAIQGSKIVMQVKGIKAGWNVIVIKLTTSTGRVNPQIINFQVII